MNENLTGNRTRRHIPPCFLLMFLLTLAPTRADDVDKIWIEDRPRQTIAGWGLDFDVMNAPRQVRETLVGESNATCFKLSLDGALYDESKGPISFRPEIWGRLIFALDLFKRHGGREYFTSSDSPPPSMKRFYTKRGHVDMNPNSLLHEREEDYVRFVINVFSELRVKGQPLPFAYSVQDDAARLHGSAACPYDPFQFCRIRNLFHTAFSQEKLPVTVVGPEATGYVASLAYLVVPEAGSPAKLDVLAYKGAGTAANEYQQALGLSAPADSPPETWMTGWACFQATNEDEAVVQTMQRLAGDLTWLGVNRWVCEAGYTREKSVYSLLYGPGTKTKLFDTLKVLWKTVPPGFHVLHAGIGYISEEESNQKHELEAIAFGKANSRVLLLINERIESRNILFSELTGGGVNVWSSKGDNNPVLIPHQPGETVPLPLAGESVSIISWQKDPSQTSD